MPPAVKPEPFIGLTRWFKWWGEGVTLFSAEGTRCLSLMWFWMLKIDQKLLALREGAVLGKAPQR